MKKIIIPICSILLLTSILYAGLFRSGKWATVRKAWLQGQPACVVCGNLKGVEVHHIIPFSVQPDLELSAANLITLCRKSKYGGLDCHILIGHRGSFRSQGNPTIIQDGRLINEMLKRWKAEEAARQ